MSVEHDAGKKRQLETAGSCELLETDEQLARRLHEELNALTRHSRRAAAPAHGPAQQQQQQLLQRSKSEKLPDSSRSLKAAGSSKPRTASDAEALLGGLGGDKADKPARKRSMLNRELAMLVTDMVDSQLKPTTGPRQPKSKDEQVVDQHKGSGEHQQQHLHAVEQLLPILKHESSSSQSEQERLALEHVQAAAADHLQQQAQQQQQQQQFTARASDSGADAAGDSGCLSGAESSGRDSSSSSGEADLGQQHTSPAPSGDQRRQQERSRQQHQGAPQAKQTAAANKAKQRAAGGASAAAGGAAAAPGGGKVIKIPKLPMVEYNKRWYRAKVLKDAGGRVLLEYQGYSHEGGPFWLPKDHPRIWRGSYKGRDWKYLGDGAWQPKTSGKPQEGAKAKRSNKPHRTNSGAAAATATAAGDGAAAADSDAEQVAARQQRRQQQQQQLGQQKKKLPHRRGVAAAAAAGGAAGVKVEGQAVDARVDGASLSERDTASADQQGGAVAAAGAVAGGASGAAVEVDSGMQVDGAADQLQQQQEEEEGEGTEQLCRTALTEAAAAMDVDPQQQQRSAGGSELEQQQQSVSERKLQRIPSTEQRRKAALLSRANSIKSADAAAAAAAVAPSPVKAEGPTAAGVAMDPAEAAAMAVPASSASTGPGRTSGAAGRAAAARAGRAAAAAASAQLLLGVNSTHEEMVAAAAAAVAVAAPPAPRGGKGGARSARSNSARSAAEGASEGTGTSGKCGRGGRNNRGASHAAAAAAAAMAAAAAAASREQGSAKQEDAQQLEQVAQQALLLQQPAASNSGSGSGQPAPGGLRVEPGRVLKHSGSSEGPLSPTSPTGGSPRAHRRKGKPRRARLDSEDLQRPTKRVRGAPKPSGYCDTAMEWQQHEQQVQMQHMLEARRQQAQLAAQQQQAAWRAAARSNSGYGVGGGASSKKSMWGSQQLGGDAGGTSSSAREARQQQQQSWVEQQQYAWSQASPRQQTLAAATAAAAAAAAAECHEAVNAGALPQHPLRLQGSEPEDVEAACVLLGAAMGRAHSGELLGAADSGLAVGAGFGSSLQQRGSGALLPAIDLAAVAADEAVATSPRFGGGRGGKRRGHNWSSNSRPPRPPVAQVPGQQQGFAASAASGFRHSLNGALPQQQQQLRRISFGGDLDLVAHAGEQQEQHSYGALGSAALAAAAAAGDASVGAALSRQGSLTLTAGTPRSAVAVAANSSLLHKPRNGISCLASSGSAGGLVKQETLRTLLDAVGQAQSLSGRPDLMFPLQFGGVPMGTQVPVAGKDGKNGVVVQPLQLLHTPVSAAAASLLAAVPSLDAVQKMAMLQGQQGGVLACLTGESPSLFL